MSEPEQSRGRRRPAAKLLLFLLLTMSTATAFWFGLVPERLNPLPVLTLTEPRPWFVDLRLAALRRHRQQCETLLAAPEITARQIDDNPISNGCGWENAVRLSSAGGAEIPVGSVTCEMAAGLALWLAHEIQPMALDLFGSRVTRVDHMGGYACRNIIGSKALGAFRSQHATANAIDISGFHLANGKHIRIARDWKGGDAESLFLKNAHRSACRYFRIALSPNFNAAHHDHFHFDRGPFVRCK